MGPFNFALLNPCPLLPTLYRAVTQRHSQPTRLPTPSPRRVQKTTVQTTCGKGAGRDGTSRRSRRVLLVDGLPRRVREGRRVRGGGRAADRAGGDGRVEPRGPWQGDDPAIQRVEEEWRAGSSPRTSQIRRMRGRTTENRAKWSASRQAWKGAPFASAHYIKCDLDGQSPRVARGDQKSLAVEMGARRCEPRRARRDPTER